MLVALLYQPETLLEDTLTNGADALVYSHNLAPLKKSDEILDYRHEEEYRKHLEGILKALSVIVMINFAVSISNTSINQLNSPLLHNEELGPMKQTWFLWATLNRTCI